MASIRKPEKLFQVTADLYLFLSSEKDKLFAESVKLFLGPSSNMKQIPVTGIKNNSSGKTVDIITSQGTLSYPAPFSHIPPAWGENQELITPLFLIDYHIIENDEVVQIKRK